METFPTEATCHEHLKRSRFGNGLFCPRCLYEKAYAFADGRTFQCSRCRRKVMARTGTVFTEKNLPLRKWYMADFLIASSKKGLSSNELTWQTEVAQKTVWFIAHRIRENDILNKPMLEGVVEIHETYVGGKERNKPWWKNTYGTQGRGLKTKSAVVDRWCAVAGSSPRS